MTELTAKLRKKLRMRKRKNGGGKYWLRKVLIINSQNVTGSKKKKWQLCSGKSQIVKNKEREN